MGYCVSKFQPIKTHPEMKKPQTHCPSPLLTGRAPPEAVSDAAASGGARRGVITGSGVPSFSEFSYADLETATNNFNRDFIVSENDENAPNIVYKGRLQNSRWIAVKKFPKRAWPDPKQFVEQAWGVGKLRHQKLATLIGYCCDGGERLLVAEYMPNNTLANHFFLFRGEIDWGMRMRVAYHIAEALEYCSSKGYPLYQDLNASRVLFDEDGEPRLSCFGLFKDSQDWKRRVSPKRVIYNLGTVLLHLLSGKSIPPHQALDVIRGTHITVLIDPHLEGKFSAQEATLVVRLASQCLQHEPTERPNINKLIATLSPLQVPSYGRIGICTMVKRSLSPMGEACSRTDLTAIHQIMITTYKRGEDEGIYELSFQEWTQKMKDTLGARCRGEYAFCHKEFKVAIDCYSQFIDVGLMISPTVYARRSLCYLMCNRADVALGDAMQAEFVYPRWPTALYMQSVALAKLDKHRDAADILMEASALEDKWRKHGRQWRLYM